jgi:hypothetical protein
MHAGWRLADAGLQPGLLLLTLVLLLAGRAFAADLLRCGRHGNIGIGHSHHLVGDAIRFMLKRIIGLSDHELSLNGVWLRR